MNIIKKLKKSLRTFVIAGAFLLSLSNVSAELKDDLVSFWPLDEIQGDKTPDIISGYDMVVENLTNEDIVEGRFGSAFQFDNAKNSILKRIHEDGEDLPANQHESFTIAMWVKIPGAGQADLRVFSEGSSLDNNPLFNIGTHNQGSDGTVDFYIRNGAGGWDTVNHLHSNTEAFDDEWRLIVYREENGFRTLNVDGQDDGIALPERPETDFPVNNSSIGGIQRSVTSHWVSGLIDEVAIWKRAITDDEIQELNQQGMESVLHPLARGLVSYWPLDEIQGNKTPDKVSGYDMEIFNLTEEDVVEGQRGNAFQFDNTRNTILSRIHNPGENLPANQHDSFTISMWVNVVGTGQSDLRVFSEGSSLDNNPLFNIGTHNQGSDGTVDFYIRNGAGGWSTINHEHSTGEAFDGGWRHLVYRENNGVRTLLIDGVADDLVLPDRPEGDFPVNNTSIGGIQRSVQSHWVSGLIDEVAIWKRALSAEEIDTIIQDGVVLPPEPPAAPLEIREFEAEFTSVAAGSTVNLSWDVNPDAQIDIQPGVGNVNDSSVFGVGSVAAQVDEDTTFVLTISRDGESISAEVSVTAAADVQDGWILIENFEGLEAGQINGQGRWLNAEGRSDVLALGSNNVFSPMGNNALSNIKLGSLENEEGSETTIFFRFYSDNAFSPYGINVGLTEKTLRFASDAGGNLGSYVRVNKTEGFFPGELQARDGIGSSYIPAPTEIESGIVYNVWMDITNDTIENGDLMNVYIARDGEERELVFEGHLGDRNPAGSQDLGAVKPNLTDLFIVSRDGTTTAGSIFLDDFFVSADGFLETVPVPASSFVMESVGGGDLGDFIITDASRDNANDTVSLTFNSVSGATYKVLSKSNLTPGADWQEVVTDIAGEPSSTTVVVENANGNESFYIISGSLPEGPQAIFFDDFESGQGDWQTGAKEGSEQWELGEIDKEGIDGPYSGSNAFATKLDGNYLDNSIAYLRSPVIDLTEATSAVLSFQTSFRTEEGIDLCHVRIVDEDGEEIIDEASGFPVSGLIEFLSFNGSSGDGWKKVSKPLPAEALGRTIRIEFQLDADTVINEAGWSVDDVRID